MIFLYQVKELVFNRDAFSLRRLSAAFDKSPRKTAIACRSIVDENGCDSSSPYIAKRLFSSNIPLYIAACCDEYDRKVMLRGDA